jgi:hypothetical protein
MQIIDNHIVSNKPSTNFGFNLVIVIVTVGDAVAIAGASTCGYDMKCFHITLLDSILRFIYVFLVIYYPLFIWFKTYSELLN